MDNNQKERAIANKLVLEAKLFYGAEHNDTRKSMISDGAAFVSKFSVWAFPSEDVLNKYRKLVMPEPKVELPSNVIPIRPKEVIVTETQKTDTKDALKVLRLEPSRLAVVHIETHGPRRKRQIARTEEKDAGEMYGVEAITITTTNERLIINPEEHEKALELQCDLGNSLRKMGTRISDGIIAFSLKKEEDFDKARQEARQKANEFNRTSTHYKVIVDAVKLQAVESDEELVARKLTYEIQRLLGEMKEALNACDVDRIRQVATEAKYKANSLQSGTEQGILLAAIEEARKAASTIGKELKEKGEVVEAIKNALNTSAVESARMMFLEYAVPEEVEMHAEATVDTNRFAELG